MSLNGVLEQAQVCHGWFTRDARHRSGNRLLYRLSKILNCHNCLTSAILPFHVSAFGFPLTYYILSQLMSLSQEIKDISSTEHVDRTSLRLLIVNLDETYHHARCRNFPHFTCALQYTINAKIVA